VDAAAEMGQFQLGSATRSSISSTSGRRKEIPSRYAACLHFHVRNRHTPRARSDWLRTATDRGQPRGTDFFFVYSTLNHERVSGIVD
jgi:hypothetical protein